MDSRPVLRRLIERHEKHVSDLILNVDTSDVHEGALDELKRAIRELVDFMEAHEPRLIAYNVTSATTAPR
jgi:hypothetical protein